LITFNSKVKYIPRVDNKMQAKASFKITAASIIL